MYERSYGDKYADLGGKYQPAAFIAKLMRQDIRAALAADALPGSAANYSVKIENYSGGRSIRIKAVDMPELWVQCPGYRVSAMGGHYGCGNSWCKAGGEHRDHPSAAHHDVLGPEGQRIEAVLKDIWARELLELYPPELLERIA